MTVTAILLTLAMLGLIGLIAVFAGGLIHRNVHIWFLNYVFNRRAGNTKAANAKGAKGKEEKGKEEGVKHVLLCFVDHYEPLVGKASDERGSERVQKWLDEYPAIANRYLDADGVPPQHSFFYPQEEHRDEHLAMICDLCAQGYGEVEVHIHHKDDTPATFNAKMQTFIDQLVAAGCLPRTEDGPQFAFIHGNWALDNSDGGEWCGLNNELILLRDLGCYADFTLPAAPHRAQTSTINSIYYATDNPDKPKSHDKGVPVSAHCQNSGDLMIIQGPLTLNWRSRAMGIWPRIETTRE